MLKIAVLIKQVPDIKKVKFDREKGVIDRKSAPNEINPFDLNALEAAVNIKEDLIDEVKTKIFAISMGPESAKDALKEALARGADHSILLTDKKFAGADTWATSLILTNALKNVGDIDLIIVGEKTTDGDTGQVGPEIAELMKIPHVSYVSNIESVTEKSIKLISEIWQGRYLKEVSFPCLITVTKDLNDPRLPSIKDKMKSRNAEVEIFDFEKINNNLNENEVGLKGSPTRIKNINIASSIEREGEIWKENYKEAIQEVKNILENKKIIGSEKNAG